LVVPRIIVAPTLLIASWSVQAIEMAMFGAGHA
jgi:hypothetical protein